MVLKLTTAPLATLIFSPSIISGSIFGGSKYQAFTLVDFPVKGIEISKGCDKSIFNFLELYCIVAIIYT